MQKFQVVTRCPPKVPLLRASVPCEGLQEVLSTLNAKTDRTGSRLWDCVRDWNPILSQKSSHFINDRQPIAGEFLFPEELPVHCSPTPPLRATSRRAGGGARSDGSGRRPGRVRWGRPLLSPPRGEFCSGDAAVQLAADSVVARSCGRPGVLMGLDGCDLVTFFSCVIRVPVCPCTPVCPVCCPGSPRSLFTGGAKTGPFRDETYPTGNTLPAGRD